MTDIEPGAVNKERTKFCCYYCHEQFPFDPSWKSIKDVPEECPGSDCIEFPFRFKCEDGYCQYSAYDAPDDAAFPDQECCECGRTQEQSEREIREEQEHTEKLSKESERIKLAKAHRERVEKGVHQNRIMHTLSSARETDQSKMWQLIRNPKSPADALRMTENEFARIKPHIENEFRLRGLDPKEHLTPSWCKQIISFFERSWLSDNEEGLRHGIEEDRTGMQRVFYARDRTFLHVRLRRFVKATMRV